MENKYTQEGIISYINTLKGYQGYIQMSDKPISLVILVLVHKVGLFMKLIFVMVSNLSLSNKSMIVGWFQPLL